MPEHAEQQLAHLLAPLSGIEPARRRPVDVVARTRRRRTVVALALAVSAAVAAGAAYGFQQLRYESVAPTAPGQPLACSPVVGETAASAERYLAERGYRVEWRFTDYAPPPHGAAAAGYSHVRERVPAAAVVEDLAWGAASSSVIVFVRAPSDADAPPLDLSTCATSRRR